MSERRQIKDLELETIEDNPRYKYQVCRDWKWKTKLRPGKGKLKRWAKQLPIKNDHLEIASDGTLTVFAGYAYDGPSGPAIDTDNFMRGALAHDAFYQLMREGLLPQTLRKYADKLCVQICKKDGMSWIRRKAVYYGLRFGAGYATRTGADPYRYR